MALLGPSGSSVYDPNAPQRIDASGSTVALGARNERQNVVKDPWQDFLYNTILGLTGSKDAFVPEYTKQALADFTANPSRPANFFPELAQPLLTAARRQEGRQQQDLMDLFRKAGGTGGGALQSGAFAQAGRQLIGDQQANENALLAAAYTPLTEQLSRNTTEAINAGLKFPQAQNTAIGNLIPLATSLRPTQVDTNVLTAGTSAEAIPSAPAAPSWLSAPSTIVNPGSWNQRIA